MRSLYESILDNDDQVRAISIVQLLASKQKITNDDVKILEKQVAIWKPTDDDEMFTVMCQYMIYAGTKCSFNWINTSEITDLTDFFSSVLRKWNGDISKWNVSKVTSLNSTFSDSSFNGDLSKWDVSRVESFTGTFANSKFNKPLKNWNVSNGETFDYMFSGASFNQDISNWDMGHAVNIDNMFEDCPIKEEYKPEFT